MHIEAGQNSIHLMGDSLSLKSLIEKGRYEMQLTPAQINSALKAISTLKKVSGALFSAADSLQDIEKVLLSSKSEVNEIIDSSYFTLPVEFVDGFDYFCFSDGACRGNPGPGAWGSLIQNKSGEVVYEGSDYDNPSTNNRMEMTGAKKCLEFLKTIDQTSKNVVVISDSKYVVDGMNQWVIGWKKRGWKKADKKVPENVDLWQELDKLRNEFEKVHFSWVKGHAGHPQNERCDQLANEALDNAGF